MIFQLWTQQSLFAVTILHLVYVLNVNLDIDILRIYSPHTRSSHVESIYEP